MKKPVVDYRQFRLSKINEPRFAHLKLFFISWIGYFTLYFLTENLIPVERCHPMHCFLDDLIPFCEFFAIFYVFWYALVFGYLVYYLLYDIDRFKKLQIFIMVTQIIAMLCTTSWSIVGSTVLVAYVALVRFGKRSSLAASGVSSPFASVSYCRLE